VGRDATNITGVLEDLKHEMEYFGLSGLTRFAIAAVDTALWDLYGKLRGEPCYLLWGAQRDRLPAYAMAGWLNYDLDELRRQCGRALEHGFRGVKMKVGAPTLEEDMERIATVRSEIGLDIPLMVDANQVLSVDVALRRSAAYAEYRIAWFEEPLVAHDFDGYAELTARSPVPVAAGENLYGREEFLAFLSRRGCRVIQPDLRRAPPCHDGGGSRGRVAPGWLRQALGASRLWSVPTSWRSIPPSQDTRGGSCFVREPNRRRPRWHLVKAGGCCR
jgi:L-alanine-DL-glutamate epimerase-like enolase superfamily enzyme